MYLVETTLVVWLVAGTFMLKRLRNTANRGGLKHAASWGSALILAVSPAAVLQCFPEIRSGISVLLAGVSFFWFCILAVRSNQTALPSDPPPNTSFERTREG